MGVKKVLPPLTLLCPIEPLPATKKCLHIADEPLWSCDISVHPCDTCKHLWPSRAMSLSCALLFTCDHPHSLYSWYSFTLSATFLNILKHKCYLYYLNCLHLLLSVHMSLALLFSISLLFLEYSPPIHTSKYCKMIYLWYSFYVLINPKME